VTPNSRVCLFCRQPLDGKIAPEHIIPESIGGWLTTYDICNPCNHRFGTTVDIFVNDPMFVELRREAGLKVGVSIRADAVDEELGDLGFWVIRPDGAVERPQDVYSDGNSVTIFGDDVADAMRKGEEINAKRVARGKPPWVFQEREAIDYGVRRFITSPTDEQVDRLNDLMVREASKIAIEFVSLLAGPSVALTPSLDVIRTFAVDGSGSITGGCDYIESSLYWLPTTRRLQAIAMTAEDKDKAQKLANLITPGDDDRWEPGPEIPRLTNIYHQMGVTQGPVGSWFVLVLFGWLRVMIRLPNDLSLPWGTYHRRGFLPKRIAWGRLLDG
jgi:hypothetical protein